MKILQKLDISRPRPARTRALPGEPGWRPRRTGLAPRPGSPAAGWLVSGALALSAGLLIGWLLLGWQLWPVQWTAALPADLSPAATEQYLDLVAESYVLTKDARLAQRRLTEFPADQQAALLADVKTRVARRLETTENILVLGADQRPGWEIWRTDSVMIVAIDHQRGQIGFVSIPRDMYVDIPDYGKERINIVDYIGEKKKYPGGGPALASRVISETFGIRTQHWARLQMDGLAKLVDALGGVDVQLVCPLYERAPTGEEGVYDNFTLPAGKSHLNGADARRFATYRYVTSDLGRQQRQQQLIWALRNRALQGNTIGRIPELWDAFSDFFETDLGLADVLRLANLAARVRSSDVYGMVFSRATLRDHTTPHGEMVLLLNDRAALGDDLARLFLKRSAGQTDPAAVGLAGECPPPPR